jgi:hypothetical protein
VKQCSEGILISQEGKRDFQKVEDDELQSGQYSNGVWSETF